MGHPSDRRQALRFPSGEIRVRLRTWHPERADRVTTGEGRLKDVSEKGFRVGDLTWSEPLQPSPGSAFAFEVDPGVSGVGYVSWSSRRGEELGARLQAEPSWQAWARARREGIALPA